MFYLTKSNMTYTLYKAMSLLDGFQFGTGIILSIIVTIITALLLVEAISKWRKR